MRTYPLSPLEHTELDKHVNESKSASPHVLQVFDPIIQKWSLATDLPSPRWGLDVLEWEGKLYSIGGGLRVLCSQSLLLIVVNRRMFF